MLYKLNQIEADVVIVLTNPDLGIVETHPQWECDQSPEALNELAARLGLTARERHGGGYVVAQIHDFRPRAE